MMTVHAFRQHSGAVDSAPASVLQGPQIDPDLELLSVCCVVSHVYPVSAWVSSTQKHAGTSIGYATLPLFMNVSVHSAL